MKRFLVVIAGLVAVAALAAPTTATASSATGVSLTDVRSAPAARPGARPATAQDRDPQAGAAARTPRLLIRDVVTSAHQPPAALFPEGATEPSIAIDPSDPRRIAITAFYDFWFDRTVPNGRNASVFYSRDGGRSWARQDTIPPGPGVVSLRKTFGPCDQTIDYGRAHRLYGTFLVCTRTGTYVITGSTTDPTRARAWQWCADGAAGCPANAVQRASQDQPQLLVNRDPRIASRDDAYVAYSDFINVPGGFASLSRVATGYGTPLRFHVDSSAGRAQPLATNPGLRLAKDPATGIMYALYERSATTGPIARKIVTYMLNRSTDGGRSWSLNGRSDGIAVATALSEQAPYYKFCGVNALLGGVTAVNVDPRNGDVYVVYGSDQRDRGGNQLYLRRVVGGRSGTVSVTRATAVTTAAEAALPSVAITRTGTVGVLFDTCTHRSSTDYPRFTAQLARSRDRGASFSALVLSRFLSPEKRSSNLRQRVLGDYQQLKAVGGVLYGVFSGNRAAFGGSVSTTDPIYFRAG